MKKYFRVNKRFYKFWSDQGFSLAELIITILIAGILASLSFPSLLQWKYFQTLKTQGQALSSSLETLKSDTMRWGSNCTLNGSSMELICKSSTMQRYNNDTFDSQLILSVLSTAVQDQDRKLIFLATNFKKLSFTPRGFVHAELLNGSTGNAIFVLGYRSDMSDSRDTAEICVSVQNLTGNIRLGQRSGYSNLSTTKSIYPTASISADQCQ